MMVIDVKTWGNRTRVKIKRSSLLEMRPEELVSMILKADRLNRETSEKMSSGAF